MINLIFYVDDDTKKYIDAKVNEVKTENINSYGLIFENIKNILSELSKLRKLIRTLESSK